MLARCGFEPPLHCIDNKISKELIAAVEDRKLTCETVPPGNHPQNPAERATQTHESHFISTLNGVDENFPEEVWDQFIPQTNTTLNLLRPCSVDPAHLACLCVFAPCDFDAHPLAPLDCCSIVHQRTVKNGGKRGTWSNEGKVGCHIGPSMDSCRAWRFCMPATKGMQETDTAEFFPNVPLPTTTVEPEILESLNRIEAVISEERPAHAKVTDDNSSTSVIKQLRQLCATDDTDDAEPHRSTRDTAAAESPVATTRVTGTPVSAPRVSKGKEEHQGVNRCRPKKKQRFPIGTRVRVKEKQKGEQAVPEFCETLADTLHDS